MANIITVAQGQSLSVLLDIDYAEIEARFHVVECMPRTQGKTVAHAAYEKLLLSAQEANTEMERFKESAEAINKDKRPYYRRFEKRKR